jgi:hypothetical protein
MKLKYLLFPVVFILIITLVSCNLGSYVIVNGTESNDSHTMSMTYEKFNGYRSAEIKVEEGVPFTISVDIVTSSGNISAYIAKDNDKANAAYAGNDIKTSHFTVTFSEPGTYTIRVDADKHSGSYKFTW